MLDRLADRIREQETLNMKIQVHNELGTSLIAISDIMEMNDELNSSDINLQIEHLQNAVSYFSSGKKVYENTLDELYNEADNMNIYLVINNISRKDYTL